MKLLHTADWQIGMRAAHAGERAAEVREARLTAAARVVALAGEAGCDGLVLAGDTFEDNAVEPALVRRVAGLLAASACPVFVLPGNHDPLGPGSVWRHPVWAEVSSRVHIFTDETPVALAGGLLVPAPCRAARSAADPTQRLAPSDGSGRLRVGVAHGALADEAREIDPDDHPIAGDAALRARVDYLALGHWHSTLLLPGPEAPRLAYPGTHETTKFGERLSGNCLVVELSAPGAPAKVEVVRTGTLTWVERDLELTEDAAVHRLGIELEALPDPERTLVRLRLQGVLGPAGLEAVDELCAGLAERFLLLRIEREGIVPRPGDRAAWLAALPDGLLRAVAGRLLDEAAGASGEVAAAALARLYALSRRAAP
jgi:DNA repair exonuclease SbcCD nuclease subunit